MAHRHLPSLTACDDLLSMLEAEARTTRHLRGHLENGETPMDGGQSLRRLCDQLVENAVESARTAAHLRDQVCLVLGVDKPNSTTASAVGTSTPRKRGRR